MKLATSIAEIQVPAQNTTLHGVIREMTAQELSLHLSLPPKNPDPFQGQHADIFCAENGVTYRAQGRIIALEGSAMKITFSKRQENTSRRAGKRVACKVPLLFRGLQPDGSKGSWKDGVILDLSLGGMGFAAGGLAVVPKRFEFSFHLGDDPTRESMARAQEGDLSVARNADAVIKPLRLQGRIAHCRPMPNGLTRYGIQYTVLSQMDFLRLAYFYEARCRVAPAGGRRAGEQDEEVVNGESRVESRESREG